VAQLSTLGVFERMKNIDTFMLFVGVGWICMGIIGLFGRRISLLRRVLFMLMSVFYAAVGFASAYHTNLNTVAGISSSAVFIIMLLLPSIIILLGIKDGYFKRKHDPDA
jgi:uncharacterized membrane protein YuzA (DUF378 family)